MPQMSDAAQPEMQINRPRRPLDSDVESTLQKGLQANSDVAFAHLVEVMVAGHQAEPSLALFVWLRPEALRSVRLALNAVADAVARALPREQFVDVLILNSAPELLHPVEQARCLLVENDPEERRRALDALSGDEAPPEPPTKPWWWPF